MESMTTVVIQIGNSDDKLSQNEWSHFFHSTHDVIAQIAYKIHFQGTSGGDMPWQNACFVAEVHQDNVAILFRDVARVARSFRQNSVAVMVGETKFI